MRCLRIYATPDGESHFGEVNIAMTVTPLFPNEAPFELSAYYPASRVHRLAAASDGVSATIEETVAGQDIAEDLAGLGVVVAAHAACHEAVET